MTVLTSEQLGVLARAVSRAPSVHNSQPWRLLVRGTEVDLLERRDVHLRRHDPLGRDRVLSCGAALTNLELAVRALGRDCHVDLRPDGEVVATVTIGRPHATSARDYAMYQAIGRRRSHRHRFFHNRVPTDVHRALVAAGETTGVHVIVPGPLNKLAELLGFATRVLRDDRGYQRELAVWTTHTHGWDALGDGVAEEALSPEALPVAGLVRAGTPVPDDAVLADRLAAENLLIICTDGDTRADHLAAGAALQRVWLTAAAKALVGSVITQPLHLTGVRARLVSELALPGVPQAIFRYGYPAVPAAPSPRLPLGELFPPPGGTR
ncbi:MULTISPECIES: Acg family FMN-binding oxidoreductase [unclassified Amycolatopsis]|uniref:Acg family FMN-binding oxidoreductase n=1 Tax=unclassified Amycolatopsis TaxID=2618356 RepID=UPI0028752A69|nr:MULTISPECIES: nitroreductase [unclassified Amycolatopsis]MDS0134735.1 nitroreductase family protein [Amycolatopsis sp. 505]MDS0148089.1 nitroreductase family protein [Amycolatopsis sp. CM201R]